MIRNIIIAKIGYLEIFFYKTERKLTLFFFDLISKSFHSRDDKKLFLMGMAQLFTKIKNSCAAIFAAGLTRTVEKSSRMRG